LSIKAQGAATAVRGLTEARTGVLFAVVTVITHLILMQDAIPTKGAPTEVRAHVRLIVIAIITLLNSLKNIAITTASGLAECGALVAVEEVPIITALDALSDHPIATSSGQTGVGAAVMWVAVTIITDLSHGRVKLSITAAREPALR
jgi:hypothetical protein